ncbi:MAG: MBL fold metallo-hydrolase [Polyangiaceae bacterium]|nr:MBL fold metallo-hydrolase [Polyangiaceae bacterium]
MRVRSVSGNRQRLDGGAMFGNAPRALWSRWCPPDELGRIDLACRALLVEISNGDGARPQRVLLEAGIGAFFEPKLRERYGVVEDDHVLVRSLAALGLTDADIDVVVLSHLHFDHAGGLLAEWAERREPSLLFPRATFVVGREAWARARAPHARDKASFVPGLSELLLASGRLELVEGAATPVLGSRFLFHVTSGHTPGMLHAWVRGRHGSAFFCADLVPGRPWVHLPVTMGYDRFPERLIDEKAAILERLAADGAWLFYTHDATYSASRVRRDDSGKYVPLDEVVVFDLDLDEPPPPIAA